MQNWSVVNLLLLRSRYCWLRTLFIPARLQEVLRSAAMLGTLCFGVHGFRLSFSPAMSGQGQADQKSAGAAGQPTDVMEKLFDRAGGADGLLGRGIDLEEYKQKLMGTARLCRVHHRVDDVSSGLWSRPGKHVVRTGDKPPSGNENEHWFHQEALKPARCGAPHCCIVALMRGPAANALVVSVT